jgi:hypothetical protein
MSVLLEILTAILQAILPMIFKRISNPPPATAEDGAANPLRKTFADKVRSTWGRTAAKGAAIVVLALCLSGCAGVRTIYIPNGDPVRLRQTVTHVQIWALDKDGVPTPGFIDLPEGWYCLPVPDAKQ